MTGKLMQVIFSSFIPEFHVIAQRVITSHCLVGIRRPGAQIEDLIIAFPKCSTRSQSDRIRGDAVERVTTKFVHFFQVFYRNWNYALFSNRQLRLTNSWVHYDSALNGRQLV